MATPIKSLFSPIEKKPFLLNKQKSGSRRPTSCIDNINRVEVEGEDKDANLVEPINKYMTTYAPEFKVVSGHDQYRCNE
jgi:hypothetical protein